VPRLEVRHEARLRRLPPEELACERWVDDPRRRKLGHHVREAMRGLGALALEQVAATR
jgi:hypothetical protein